MQTVQLPQSIQKMLRGNGTSSQLLTSEELQQRRVDGVNKTVGTLTGFACPNCLNKGYLMRLDGQHRTYTVECKCMATRRNTARIEKSGLKELLTRYTMEAWQTPERWQKRAKELALRYADDQSGKWFVMVGSVGTGKSHLCTALAGMLMERSYDTRYVLWREFSVRAKAAVNDEYAYRQLVEPLKRVRCLYIDDLFKTGKGQAPTVGDVNLAFEILGDRYNDTKKRTMISSEYTVDEMLEIDEAVGSRIYERSNGFYLPLVGMENWRLK